MLREGVQHGDVSAAWLQQFARALSAKDASAASDLFHPEGWLRDVLILSWDSRSLEGRPRIQEYLESRLGNALFDVNSFKLDERGGLAPTSFDLSGNYSGIEAAFTFETAGLFGRGFLRLILAERAQWKALSVYVCPGDIKGYEENVYELGIYGDHTLPWTEVNAERIAATESSPHVLVSKWLCSSSQKLAEGL